MVQQFYNYKDTSIGGALAQGLQGLTEGGVQGFQLGMRARALAAQEAYQQAQVQHQQKSEELQAEQLRQTNIKTFAEMPGKMRKALFPFYSKDLIGDADPNSEGFKAVQGLVSDDEVAGAMAAYASEAGMGPGGLKTIQGLIDSGNLPGAVQIINGFTQNKRMTEAAAADQSFKQQQMSLQNDQFIESVRHNKATEQNAAASTGTAKLPAGYSWADETHTQMVPIPGGPGDPQNKPLTESQGKASDQMLRAQRAYDRAMEFSAKNPDYIANSGLDQSLREGLGGVAGGVAGGAIGGVVGGAAGTLIGHPVGGVTTGASLGAGAGAYVGSELDPLLKRWLQSDEGKAFEAAWAPFINANLRRDTGAAVTAQEWAYAFQQFIPMPGDPPEAMATKKANAQDVIEGMRLSAGPGADRISPQGESSSGGGMPTISSQAAYDQLPRGAQYRTADGRIGTKR